MFYVHTELDRDVVEALDVDIVAGMLAPILFGFCYLVLLTSQT